MMYEKALSSANLASLIQSMVEVRFMKNYIFLSGQSSKVKINFKILGNMKI